MIIEIFSARTVFLVVACATLLLSGVKCCLAAPEANFAVTNNADESILIDSDYNASNCVDASINQFCCRIGCKRSKKQIESAIMACGLEPSPGHRSLLECRALLKELGIPVEVIPMNRKTLATTTEPFILFLEPQVTNMPGHAIVLWPQKSSGIWNVFDPKNGKIRALDAALEMRDNNFYAVVSKDKVQCARLSLALRGALLSALCGLLFGSAIAFYSAGIRRFAHSDNKALGTLTAFTVLLSTLTGCTPQTESQTIELSHNFGVLRNAISAEHSFVVTNKSRANVTCQHIKASCSCMSNNSSFIGKTIGPGESFVYPMQIDVTKKVGDFSESLVIEFVKASSEDNGSREHAFNVLLITSGVVEQDPYASETRFLFELSDSDSLERAVDVHFWRAKESAPPKLKSAVVKSLMETGESFAFDVMSSRLLNPENSGSGVMYTLSLNVRFNGDSSFRWKEADLVLAWDDRPGTTTVCHLMGRVKPPLDCVESTIRISPIAIGSESMEFVPIVVNDKSIIASLSLECSSEAFAATLAQDAGGVIITFSPKTSGVHNAEVFYIVGGEKVSLFKVAAIGR